MMALEDLDFKSEDEDEGNSENSDYWLIILLYQTAPMIVYMDVLHVHKKMNDRLQI